MSAGRQLLQRWIPLAVSASALLALFWGLDARAVAQALSWHVAAVLVPALLAYGAATLLLEAVSVLRLLPRPHGGFGLAAAARIKCASYLLLILHYALGVAGLTWLLHRSSQRSLAEAAGVVLLISAVDLGVVLAFAAGGAAFLELDLPIGSAALLFAGLAAGGLALLRSDLPLGPLERLRGLPGLSSLRAIPLPRLAELLLLRAVFSSCLISLTGAAFVAFGLWPGLPLLVAGMMVVALVTALPIAVAGLGTGQAAFVFVFRGVAEPEALLAVSLVLSAGMILLRAGMGLLFAREFAREVLAHRAETGA